MHRVNRRLQTFDLHWRGLMGALVDLTVCDIAPSAPVPQHLRTYTASVLVDAQTLPVHRVADALATLLTVQHPEKSAAIGRLSFLAIDRALFAQLVCDTYGPEYVEAAHRSTGSPLIQQHVHSFAAYATFIQCFYEPMLMYALLPLAHGPMSTVAQVREHATRFDVRRNHMSAHLTLLGALYDYYEQVINV